MRAERDDQIGAVFIRQKQGGILACPRHGEQVCVEAQRLDPVQPRRRAVFVGMHNDLRPAAQGIVGNTVHVAENNVGPMAEFQQSVRRPVYRNQHRPVVG